MGAGGRSDKSKLLLPCPRYADLAEQATVRAVDPSEVRYPSIPAEGYRISIDPERGTTLAASDDRGLFYGRATLRQIRRVWGGGDLLPAGTIEDWPDLAVRGVMLDVSRTKVPSLETLYGIVDRLASWKVNHLELYTEHTFSYREHREVWAKADPYTAEDLERLASYCADRHVELVPNQNTLGHMERWLLHERYAPLGLARGVVTGPFGMPFPASTLDPSNPASLELVRGLLGELAGALPGARFHVGLDEPWELPAHRSGQWAQWVAKLRLSPELGGREMLVWGDFLAAHPDLLEELPEGVTVCEWGYEADHPFASRSARLSRAGVSHWLCPGTSSWMSILGRTTNAVESCRSAAVAAAGSAGDVRGIMVTDWGDFGHLQYLPVSDPGLAAAAAFSWCESSNAHLDASGIARLLDLHCFEDPTGHLADALVRLGDVHTLLPCQFPNLSTLVMHLYLPQLPVGAALTEGLESSHLDAVEAEIAEAVETLGGARPSSDHGSLATEELANSARLTLLACKDARGRLEGAGHIRDLAERTRSELAEETADVIGEHRRLWSRRNRAGGVDESCAWLEHLRACYVAGEADADWAGPLVDELRHRR